MTITGRGSLELICDGIAFVDPGVALAHELTHVVQNRHAPGPASQAMSSPGDRAEQEADAVERAIDQDGPVIVGASAPSFLARFVPAEAEVEEDVDVEDDVDEELDEEGHPRSGSRTGRPRHAPPIGSLAWVLKQNRLGATKDRAESAVGVSMDHGGKSPDFITKGPETEGISDAGSFTYQPQTFHVLSALEYDVGRATSSRDLSVVFYTYFPGSGTDQLGLSILRPTTLGLASSYDELDPGQKKRMKSFAKALLRKVQEDPAMQDMIDEFFGQKVDLSAKSKPKPKPKAEPVKDDEPGAKGAAKSGASPAPTGEKRDPSLYPICWSAYLPSPTQRLFARVEKEERDQGEQQSARIKAEGRAALDPDFDPSKYHVHHVVPLFLGGEDNLKKNGKLWPARTHLRGHADLNYQPQ